MSKENTIPLINKTAFSCPHCGAYTTQTWYKVVANQYPENSRTPYLQTQEDIERYKTDELIEKEDKEKILDWAGRILNGKPFFESTHESLYNRPLVNNCNLSKCYNCKEISTWIHDQLVYPNIKIDIQPNIDLPDNIRYLFEEAREIVNISPKGSAALLRLCIQYLCKELGESGKNIDKDIASLVTKGLNPVVQKALDIVRVVGNQSVHPGELDLNDNKQVAIKLFGLVNLISEQMISHPKQVTDLYASLPAEKLEFIDVRDAKSKKND